MTQISLFAPDLRKNECQRSPALSHINLRGWLFFALVFELEFCSYLLICHLFNTDAVLAASGHLSSVTSVEVVPSALAGELRADVPLLASEEGMKWLTRGVNVAICFLPFMFLHILPGKWEIVAAISTILMSLKVNIHMNIHSETRHTPAMYPCFSSLRMASW